LYLTLTFAGNVVEQLASLEEVEVKVQAAAGVVGVGFTDQVTVPVGAVGLLPVSTTVAVQLTFALSRVHVTLVVVGSSTATGVLPLLGAASESPGNDAVNV
jgi:hypothetical protein